MQNVEEAYQLIANTLLTSASPRPWLTLEVDAPVLGDNLGGTRTFQKLEDGGEIDLPVGWGIFEIQKAALYLRDHLLRTTGRRIWGLTFTLYPDGKFNIEYDYTKPEGYEEMDDTVEVNLADLQSRFRPDTPENAFLTQCHNALQARTDELASKWGFGSEASWNLDMNAGVLTFTFDDGRVVEKPVQVIGTFDTATGTFLWGWDHPSVPGKWLPDGRIERADTVNGRERFKVTYATGGERKVSIWELRPGKRNRALVMVSMWVKR